MIRSWSPAGRSNSPGQALPGDRRERGGSWLRLALVCMLAMVPCWSFAAGDARAVGTAGDGAPPAPEDALFVTLRASLASPQFSEFPVATVNNEPITLGELKDSLALSHEAMSGDAGTAESVDFAVFLDRLVTVRLFLQEARTMGIADLPEITAGIERFREALLKREYERSIIRDVEADAAEVEKLYRENVREWKVRSVMFKKEEDAAKMEAAIRGGASFEDAAAEALSAGTVAGSSDAAFVRAKALQPQVAEVLLTMRQGSVSPIITIGAGKMRAFALVKLEDERYPDDAEARENARMQVQSAARQKAVLQRRAGLIKKFARIDAKLLDSLDYEAKKPGLERLEQDRRTLSTVKGGAPVRVSDLTAALKKKFFHGMGQAAQSKKINREKKAMLDEVLEKSLFLQEARRLGLDRTPEYAAQVREFETTTLFGSFITKVVQPEVKVQAEEKEAYYRDHGSEFLAPDSLRLASLAFGAERDAASALEKLRKGTDLSWLREHAEGRLPDDTPGLARLGGEPVQTANLPKGIAEALGGAAAGEYRLGRDDAGRSYVIAVLDVMPGRPLPLDIVGPAIEKRLYGEKLNKAVDAWAERLRRSSDITINMVDAKH